MHVGVCRKILLCAATGQVGESGVRAAWRGGSSGGGLHQIPEVPVEVFEDGDGAVGLLGGRADEADAASKVRLMVAPETVRLQEQEDTPAGLVADEGLLLRR